MRIFQSKARLNYCFHPRLFSATFNRLSIHLSEKGEKKRVYTVLLLPSLVFHAQPLFVWSRDMQMLSSLIWCQLQFLNASYPQLIPCTHPVCVPSWGIIYHRILGELPIELGGISFASALITYIILMFAGMCLLHLSFFLISAAAYTVLLTSGKRKHENLNTHAHAFTTFHPMKPEGSKIWILLRFILTNKILNSY